MKVHLCPIHGEIRPCSQCAMYVTLLIISGLLVMAITLLSLAATTNDFVRELFR